VLGGLTLLPTAPPVRVDVATAGCVVGTDVLLAASVGVLVKFAAVCVAWATAVWVRTTTAVWVAFVTAVAVEFAVVVCSAAVAVFVGVAGIAVLVGEGVPAPCALTDVAPPPITTPSTMSPTTMVAAPAMRNPAFVRSTTLGFVVLVCMRSLL